MRKYQVLEKSIAYTSEVLKQMVKAIAAKIERYGEKVAQYRDNRMFHNKKRFYQGNGKAKVNEVSPNGKCILINGARAMSTGRIQNLLILRETSLPRSTSKKTCALTKKD